MAFTTSSPTARPTARPQAVVARSAVPRKFQNAVASVMAAVPLILSPAAFAGDLELPKIDYGSAVIMDNERASQTEYMEPDTMSDLRNTSAKAQAALPDANSDLTKEFVESAKNLFAGDLGEAPLPTDVQADDIDIAAAAEKGLNKAKTNALEVTDDGPLSAATQTANDAGKEAAGEVKKFFGLF